MSNPADTTAIRRATADDAAALAELGAATFVETFGHLYPPADLKLFLDDNHTAQSWLRLLTKVNQATWLVEHRGGRKIGFITVGACKLPVQHLEPAAGEIQQLYVHAEFHNLRLGTRLMDTSLEWLAAQSLSPVYVGVWSENFCAQRFYARYGFTKIGEYGFPVGSTVDREFILKR